MPDLTDDEFTLLEIMSRGEAMMAIGRWERPLKSLAQKGMADPQDGFNYIITSAGRTALGGHKQEVDTDWANSFVKVNNTRYFERTSKDKSAGVYVVQGVLFFKLLDGSTLTCNCIKDPYASKIVELFNGCNVGQERPGLPVVSQSSRPAEPHPQSDQDSGDGQAEGNKVRR
jgi:hypothetical protein